MPNLTINTFTVAGANVAPTDRRRVLKRRLHALPSTCVHVAVRKGLRTWSLSRRADGRWVIDMVTNLFVDAGVAAHTLAQLAAKLNASADVDPGSNAHIHFPQRAASTRTVVGELPEAGSLQHIMTRDFASKRLF